MSSSASSSAPRAKCLEIVKAFPHPGEVHRARHMPQHPNVMAAIGPSGDVMLYDLDTENPAEQKNQGALGRCKGHGDEGYGLAWSSVRASRLVTAANDGTVCFWDTMRPSMKMSPATKLTDANGASVNDLSLSSTSADIAYSASEAKRIDVWDARKKGGPALSTLNAHADEVMSVDASPLSEHLLLSGGADSVIKLWDTRKMSSFIHSMEGVHEGDVTAVRWSPHHIAHFLSAGDDRRANVWDLGRIGQEQTEEDGRDGPPELLFCHGGHTGAVTDISWNLSSGSEFLVASVSDDNIFQCWQMQKTLYTEDNEKVPAAELE